MASSTHFQSSDAKLLELENDLTRKSGTELLDTWDEYITYMEQKHPRKVRERIALMRRCVLHYRKRTEFNEIAKFVNIWLKLAATLDEPKLIYEKMEECKIGSSLAIFYRDWAEYCAHNGFHDDVMRILEKGEKCNAGPCDILAKCKEDLLTPASGESRRHCSAKTKTKINRSHLYYDADMHSAPGTVVKYHKASIYGEAYERSFDELKAKLPKYSLKQIRDNKVISSTNNRNKMEELIGKPGKGDQHVGEILPELDDDLSEGVIDVDDAEQCHDDSHSFLDDYMSSLGSEENPSSLEHFEPILLDLDVTRKHIHSRDINTVTARQSIIQSTANDTRDEVDTCVLSTRQKQTIKPKSPSPIFQSENDTPHLVSTRVLPSTEIKEVHKKQTLKQIFGSPVINPHVDERKQHEFKRQQQESLFNESHFGEASPSASPDKSFEKMFAKSPSPVQAKGFQIFSDESAATTQKQPEPHSEKKVKCLDFFPDVAEQSRFGTSMTSHDRTSDSDVCKGKFDVTNTPGCHTGRTQNILSNMFSDTIAWEPGNESSEFSKSNISFDQKFEKSIFQDNTSNLCQGKKNKNVNFKILKDSSMDSSQESENKFTAQPKGFQIFQDSSMDETRDKKEVLKQSAEFKEHRDKPVLLPSGDEYKESKLSNVRDEAEPFFDLRKTVSSCDVTADSDILDKKSPGVQTLCTQNIFKMFSTTVDFQDQSSEMAQNNDDTLFEKKMQKGPKKGFEIFTDNSQNDDTLFDKKPRNVPSKAFEIFRDATVCLNEEEGNEVAIQPKGFKIFHDESRQENGNKYPSEGFKIYHDEPVVALVPKENKFSKNSNPCQAEKVQDQQKVGVSKQVAQINVSDKPVPSGDYSKTITSPVEEALDGRKLDLDITGTPGVPRYESTAYFGAVRNTKNANGIKKKESIFCDKFQQLKQLGDFSGIEGSPNNVEDENTNLNFLKSGANEEVTGTPGITKYESTAYFGAVSSSRNTTDCNAQPSSTNKENNFGDKIHQLKQLGDFFDLDHESPDIDASDKKNLLKPNVGEVKRKRERADLFGAASKLDKEEEEEEVERKSFKRDPAGETDSIVKQKDSQLKRQKQILAELSNLEEVSAPNAVVDFLMPKKSQKREQLGKNFTGSLGKREIASLLGSPLQDANFGLNQTEKFEQMFEKDSNTEIFSIIQDKSVCGSDRDKVSRRKHDTESAPQGVENPGVKGKSLLNDFSLNNDSVQQNVDKRKRSLSTTEEDGNNARLKRFISTPSSPGRNHCITFNQQVSQIIPNINFEKTQNSELYGLSEKTQNSHLYEDAGINLSPIAERSNEDSKGSGDQTKGSGDSSNEANDVTKATNRHDDNNLQLSHHNQITMNNEQIINFVKKVTAVIETYENFQEDSGPLPKLQGATMNLNIGTRSIRICKCIEKQDSYALYSAQQGREDVTVKCLEKTLTAFYRCVWDVYIGNEIHKRIDSFSKDDFLLYQDKTLLDNFLRHNLVCIFDDSIYIESMSFTAGTVMDTINIYKNNKCMMDETLALLYTYEILNIIYTLHNIDIIHGDLNPSVFFQQDISCMTDIKPITSRLITLKKFSMSIDLSIIEDRENVMFLGSNSSTTYLCPEMREGKPWKYNTDYYSGAATIHMIAFQREMAHTVDLNETLTIIKTLIPGEWNSSLWREIFSTLLIPSSPTISNMIPLISKIGARLVDPKTVEKLKQAHLKTYYLCFDDDKDDEDDD